MLTERIHAGSSEDTCLDSPSKSVGRHLADADVIEETLLDKTSEGGDGLLHGHIWVYARTFEEIKSLGCEGRDASVHAVADRRR